MLKRIRYVSRQVKPMSEAEVDALVDAAAAANERQAITGALVVADEVFFQIIEGPPEAIDSLFSKLEADDRHMDVICLDSKTEREIRLFPAWSMRRVGRTAGPATARMKELVHEIAGARVEARGPMTDELASMMRTALRAA